MTDKEQALAELEDWQKAAAGLRFIVQQYERQIKRALAVLDGIPAVEWEERTVKARAILRGTE